MVNVIEESLANKITIENPYYPRLKEAMEYSLLAGGKRLRPVLALATAEIFDKEGHEVLEYACSIEMIHTYSLIHDDLPAMDNEIIDAENSLITKYMARNGNFGRRCASEFRIRKYDKRCPYFN